MLIDNHQKPTSKSTLLKLMLLQAWKERWTDCQWGINVKTILTRGVSGDVYNLADCIMQQAIVGSGANVLFLSYLKHSLCAHLISHAAVLSRISKFENFDKSHSMIALLEFLDTILSGVTCRGKQEEATLTKAMLSMVHWLMQAYEQLLESHIDNRRLTAVQQEVVDRLGKVLRKIVHSPYLFGVICISRYENTELFSEVQDRFNAINSLTMRSGFVAPIGGQKNVTVMDYMRKVVLVDVNGLEVKEFESKTIEPLTYCMQPLIAIEVLFNPTCDTQLYVGEFLNLQRLKGYTMPRLYCEIMRACLISLNNVEGSSKESFVCAFTFIKVPHILRQIHQQMDGTSETDFIDDKQVSYSPDVVEAFELLLLDSPVLDFMDAKCACNIVECMLKEMVKHQLVTEKHVKNFTTLRDPFSSGLKNLEDRAGSNQLSIMLKYVFRVEPPLVGILKTLNSDYNKVQDALFGMLCQVLSGNSFELVLSVATVEGKFRSFVSGLIKCNENSLQPCTELGKNPATRAALFDVSFLMLSLIVQNFGTEVVLQENSDSFFENWVRDSMVEKNKQKSAMQMVNACDPSKVDELIININMPEGLKGSTLKWNEICSNIPGLLYQVLLAWESETLSTTDIKKILDCLKTRFGCFAVSATSWLCAYMQIVRQEELLKPMNMVQHFLVGISTEELKQPENYKERLMVQIIRKMQQEFQRLPMNVKVRAMSHVHQLISSTPLEEQFNESWKCVSERGWMPIKTTIIFHNLLNSCGPFWMMDKLVNQLFLCKSIRDLNKTMDLVFAIMHLDIERCTVALLSQLVPMMLLNKHTTEINDPHSKILAKLCIYSIIVAMEAPMSPTKKRSRVLATETDELGALCPNPKIRKLGPDGLPCESSSRDFLLEESFSERETTVSLREPLQGCLQTLFRTFTQYITTDELSPKVYFMFQFLSLLVEIGKDRIKPVLKLIPNGLIQNMLKINSTDEVTAGLILRLYDLNAATGRQFAMSDLCLLRNIQMRKESIKL